MSDSRWQKSSFCGGGGNNCIELAAVQNRIAIRESQEPEEVALAATAALRGLIHAVKSGTLQ